MFVTTQEYRRGKKALLKELPDSSVLEVSRDDLPKVKTSEFARARLVAVKVDGGWSIVKDSASIFTRKGGLDKR